MKRAALVAILCAGCGLEGIFNTTPYDPTPAPRVQIAFSAPSAMTVEVWGPDGKMIAAAPAAAGLIDLGEHDFSNLRLVARAADTSVLARGVIADAARTDHPIDAGTLDAHSTAAGLLVDARVDADGLTLDSTPVPIVAEIARQAAAAADPAIATFATTVAGLSSGALAPLGSDLDATWASANGPAAAAYAAALAAAVAKIDVPIVCDPALIRVMFTVDVSGQSLDGNGATQLIRQPPATGKVFLGLTVDDSSPIADSAGLLPGKITPNDPAYVMYDDGTGGDEVAGDGVFTRVVTLPRGMRIIYKYTDGAAGDGFTHTEEWPGNARILQIDDVVTKNVDGRPDCLVVRRDTFGDEASNKDFTSLAAGLKATGGALGWDVDLGGPNETPLGSGSVAGGLALYDERTTAPLTPVGIPEARENGVCTRCPAPLVLSPGDTTPPTLLGAAFLSSTTIEVRFSEAMAFAPASDPSAYLVVDTSLRALPIEAAAALGDRVRLTVSGPDLGQIYTLHVRHLPDASTNANPLAGPDQVTVGADVTPPRPLSARAGSRKELDPQAVLADPTVGEIVAVSFSEELDQASAEDLAHYQVADVFGQPLAVRGAFRNAPDQVLVVTDPQIKGRKYTITVRDVADLAGNTSPPTDPLPFAGYALYKVTFGVVPGFAFATRDGSVRGIPHGERMYVTGTPLAVAHDPQDGTDLSIGGRTDVTGVPEFELIPGATQYMGKPVYSLSILVPPGVYAWKAAHGVPGEWTTPPQTLVKVTKSLGTTDDATGVNIDPVTLLGRNDVNYTGAVLSLNGTDSPSPGVIFKREDPDEICVVTSADVTCPTIVVGTWRDLDDWTAGGKLNDYDDAQADVPLLHLTPDTSPPNPIYVQVRDSESLLIAFDEAIASSATVTVAAASDDATGATLAIVDAKPRAPQQHEIEVQTAVQNPSGKYVLTISGLVDDLGNAYPAPLEIRWTSPSTYIPFVPFEDHNPPVLLGATALSPTSLRVRFDEPLAPSAADPSKFTLHPRGADPAPTVSAAVLSGSGKDVILTTSTQAKQGQFTVAVTNISDVAVPPNVLASAQTDFVGFGDTTPPALSSARAIAPGLVALIFSKSLDEASAMSTASYSIAGATVTGVEFSGDPALRSSCFDPGDAPSVAKVVLLHTSNLTVGQNYAVTAAVTDLSGNAGGGTLNVTGTSTTPTVNVVLEVLVSDTQTVAGRVPPRALSLARLAAEREGVFAIGLPPGGFPPEGSPLDGVEPELVDAAGTGVYSITIPAVPLGSVLQWKSFASYTVAWKNAHPNDPSAAFADPLPGPSAFSDGQEYPGNEDGVRVMGDLSGSGTIHLRVVFGDEVTYKKLSQTVPFLWVVEDFSYAP